MPSSSNHPAAERQTDGDHAANGSSAPDAPANAEAQDTAVGQRPAEQDDDAGGREGTPRRAGRWVGVAPADRKAERRELLIDAAFDLLGTEGLAGTSVRAVCQAARLNPRYFYESFGDLDELVVATYDRVVEQLAAEIVDAADAAGEDPGSQLRAAIGRTVDFVDEDRRRAQVLYVEALGNEALNRRRIGAGHDLIGLMEHRAATHHGRHPEGEQIRRITAAVMVGGLSELLVAWLAGRITVSRAQLVEDAAELFIALGTASAKIAARRGS
ncbi:MAG: TetR/AcrR family transcriptional regulator [Actinomycetota bacterium]|nr:TetR/AcrR family transcriptional regulator [Actinomycetota bacterium]